MKPAAAIGVPGQSTLRGHASSTLLVAALHRQGLQPVMQSLTHARNCAQGLDTIAHRTGCTQLRYEYGKVALGSLKLRVGSSPAKDYAAAGQCVVREYQSHLYKSVCDNYCKKTTGSRHALYRHQLRFLALLLGLLKHAQSLPSRPWCECGLSGILDCSMSAN